MASLFLIVFLLGSFFPQTSKGLGDDFPLVFPGDGAGDMMRQVMATEPPIDFLQQLQDLIPVNPAQAEVIRQLIVQLLTSGETATASPASGLQQFQDLLGDEVQAAVVEQLIRQLLGDTQVPDGFVEQVANLLISGSQDILIQVLQDLLAPSADESNGPQVVLLGQIINQLLGNAEIPNGFVEQVTNLLASGSLDGLIQAVQELLSSFADGSNGIQDVIIEQILNQLLGDAEVPEGLEEQIVDLIASGSLDRLIQVLQELLSSLADGSDGVQVVIIEQIISQLLGDTGALDGLVEQVADLLNAGSLNGLIDVLQELSSSANRSNEAQTIIMEQIINQLLGDTQVPDGVVEQVADLLASDSLEGLIRQFQDFLLAAANGSNTGLDFFSDNSTFLQDPLQLLVNLSLVPEEINWQDIALTFQGELQRYIQNNVLQNVSTVCANNTLQFLTDIASGKPYASQMWLSNGDFLNMEALTTYNTHSIGNVEQCQAVKEWNTDAPFETQYCTLAYLASVATLSVGTCVPSSCSNVDLTEMFGAIPGLERQSIVFSCIVNYPLKTGAIVTICILWVFLLMVVIGTVYHVTFHRRIRANITKTKAKIEKMEEALSGRKIKSVKEKEIEHGADINGNLNLTGTKHFSKNSHNAYNNDGFVDVEGALEATENAVLSTHAPEYCTCVIEGNKKKAKKMGFLDTFLMGFSALHNGAKIMNTKEVAGNLGALNGIRVISMWWIILGHTIYYMTTFLDDPLYAGTELYSSFWFSVILYATVSVDTFFFLSGLLLVYLTLKHLEKANGKLNWALFYLHRFIRITPTYMICIAIWTTLAIHFGQGPGKIDLFEAQAENCRESWWTNLLYINNLYPFPGDLGKQCMGWSWYLANDMQFFVISPVIIYLLYKHSKMGIGLIVALCLGSFGLTAYIATYYGVPLGASLPYNNNTVVVYENFAADIIYSKPYCRIPAYLVGMVFGYIFFRLNGRPFKMNKWVNIIMWIIAVGVGLAIVYGPYRSDGERLPQYAAVMYTTFSRAGFVMAVGWVAFSCVVGYGGPVNSLLSWSFWAPLSRITFCAYLLHSILIFVFYSTAKSQYHFTYIQLASSFIGNTVLSYAAAFILSIGVEGPVMGLEKALLGGGAGGKKN